MHSHKIKRKQLFQCFIPSNSLEIKVFYKAFSVTIIILCNRTDRSGPGGGTPVLGQYGYVPSESPQFFGLGHSYRLLFQKYNFLVPLFQHGLLQNTILLKNMCLSFLVPKSPGFSVRGCSESPLLIFSKRLLPKHPIFKPLEAHIYHFRFRNVYW